MKLDVIAISGKAGSGKDFIYLNYLSKLGYKRWALADHFKIWAVGRDMATYEEVFYTKPPNVRQVLQKTGTEEGRNLYGVDIWCNTAKAWMEHLSITWNVNKFCITDIRFPNEVEFIKSMGGKVFRINAPERSANSSLSDEARKHISETALDDYPLESFDAVIQNDPQHKNFVEEQIYDALGLGQVPRDTGEFWHMDVEEAFTSIKDKFLKDIL